MPGLRTIERAAEVITGRAKIRSNLFSPSRIQWPDYSPTRVVIKGPPAKI